MRVASEAPGAQARASPEYQQGGPAARHELGDRPVGVAAEQDQRGGRTAAPGAAPGVEQHRVLEGIEVLSRDWQQRPDARHAVLGRRQDMRRDQLGVARGRQLSGGYDRVLRGRRAVGCDDDALTLLLVPLSFGHPRTGEMGETSGVAR